MTIVNGSVNCQVIYWRGLCHCRRFAVKESIVDRANLEVLKLLLPGLGVVIWQKLKRIALHSLWVWWNFFSSKLISDNCRNGLFALWIEPTLPWVFRSLNDFAQIPYNPTIFLCLRSHDYFALRLIECICKGLVYLFLATKEVFAIDRTWRNDIDSIACIRAASSLATYGWALVKNRFIEV